MPVAIHSISVRIRTNYQFSWRLHQYAQTPITVQFNAIAYLQGRVAFLPFLKIRLKSAKPGFPKTYAPGLPGALHRRRDELELFQKEVAKQMGINQWTYINWEKGYRFPVITKFHRVIEFLGYDPFYDPEESDLPGRIKAARRRLGFSHKQFGATYDIDPSCVARWEKGLSTPAPRSLKKLDRVFGKKN